MQNPACAHTLIHYQASHQESDRKLALLGFPVGALWWPPPVFLKMEDRLCTQQAARSGFLPACWSTPLQQSPPPSDKHNKGDATEGLWCLSLLEAFPHTSITLLLSERQVTADGTGPVRWLHTDHCSHGFLLTKCFLSSCLEPPTDEQRNHLSVKCLRVESAHSKTPEESR